MDGLLLLLALALLAAVLLGPVSFLMLLQTRRRVAELERRLAGQAATVQPAASAEAATDDARDEGPSAAATTAGESSDTLASEAVPPPLPVGITGDAQGTPAADGTTADQSQPEAPAAGVALDTESKIGGKLTIWIGGLALAFGGLFLVRYAIENAILGPAARVSLGFGFGLIVAIAGELLRRRQGAFQVPGFDKANIPATLTAVGIFSMFAAVYAAHALYELIGPVASFILLAALALASLGLSLVHGPSLAAIGLLASYVTPFLIEAETDSITVVALYVLAVSAAAMSVARLRGWAWLALTVVAALTLFGFGFALGSRGDQPIITDLYLAGAFALGLVIFVLSFDGGSRAASRDDNTASGRIMPHHWLATVALSVLVLPFLPTLIWDKAPSLEWVELAVLLIGPLALVYRYPELRYLLIAPFIAGCLRYLTLGLPAVEVPAELLDGPSLYAAELYGSIHVFAATGFAFAVAVLGIGFVFSLRSPARALVAAATSAATVGLLLVAYFRIEQFASSLTFALFALVLAALFYVLAMRIHATIGNQRPGWAGAVSSYLIGSIISLIFAVAAALQGPAMTVSLGLIPVASAFVYARYQLPALRIFALISLVPYALRLLWEPLIDPEALATSPILFNHLLWGYGLPALGLSWAAWQLSRVKIDVWAEALQTAAIVACISTVGLLALHAIDPTFKFPEKAQELAVIATGVLIGGSFSLGLTRISVRSQLRLPRLAADGLSLIGILVGAFGLLLARNPVLDGLPQGGINVGDGFMLTLIHYAYLLPALLFGTIAVLGRPTKAHWLIIANGVFSVCLAFLWVNLSVRQMFSPGFLAARPVEQGELYVYSAIWLVIGLVVLGLGITLRSFLLRAGSGLILVLVTLKVFLIDLSELDGILRPISFIGLGLVLLAIGLVYQRALGRIQMARQGPQANTGDQPMAEPTKN